jgi:hypothetical protein
LRFAFDWGKLEELFIYYVFTIVGPKIQKEPEGGDKVRETAKLQTSFCSSRPVLLSKMYHIAHETHDVSAVGYSFWVEGRLTARTHPRKPIMEHRI